jgi:hypothetical protein
MNTHRIYVASSWRNTVQPVVVDVLRAAGHEVYDFKSPPKRSGFSWREISPSWEDWTTAEYSDALLSPQAQAGFESDFNAMRWATCCVLVLPCGRSAHLEAGWFTGAGKTCLVLVPEGVQIEPELMYLLAGRRCIFSSVVALAEALSKIPPRRTLYQIIERNHSSYAVELRAVLEREEALEENVLAISRRHA